LTNPIRVLVVDDHPLFREGVVNSLINKVDIDIVGEAEDGEKGLELARELLPDAVLLDITMPGKSGITVAAEIGLACPATQIIMLTASEHDDDLMKAFKAGAKGYVLKGVSGSELAGVIRSVVKGEVYVSPNLASELLFELSKPSQPDPLDSLTIREREILELVAEGLTNREIGKRLHLAEATIKHYMTNVLQKMHVRSRVQAALLAKKSGFGSD
jgi:DNA-binding NarL/FixJ family response regulator